MVFTNLAAMNGIFAPMLGNAQMAIKQIHMLLKQDQQDKKTYALAVERVKAMTKSSMEIIMELQLTTQMEPSVRVGVKTQQK